MLKSPRTWRGQNEVKTKGQVPVKERKLGERRDFLISGLTWVVVLLNKTEGFFFLVLEKSGQEWVGLSPTPETQMGPEREIGLEDIIRQDRDGFSLWTPTY